MRKKGGEKRKGHRKARIEEARTISHRANRTHF